jgi:hypothetical protein
VHDGGQTSVPNINLLCPQQHHPMKSAGGVVWRDEHGDWRITPPAGWNPQTRKVEPRAAQPA